MPVPKSLSFTALPKNASDPVHARRAKFVAKLEEQKLLLQDPNHVRTVQRWTKVNGERQATTKQQAVRPWWKEAALARYCTTSIMYGISESSSKGAKAITAVREREQLGLL